LTASHKGTTFLRTHQRRHENGEAHATDCSLVLTPEQQAVERAMAAAKRIANVMERRGAERSADAIRALLARLAQVEAERDALRKDKARRGLACA